MPMLLVRVICIKWLWVYKRLNNQLYKPVWLLKLLTVGKIIFLNKNHYTLVELTD